MRIWKIGCFPIWSEHEPKTIPIHQTNKVWGHILLLEQHGTKIEVVKSKHSYKLKCHQRAFLWQRGSLQEKSGPLLTKLVIIRFSKLGHKTHSEEAREPGLPKHLILWPLRSMRDSVNTKEKVTYL